MRERICGKRCGSRYAAAAQLAMVGAEASCCGSGCCSDTATDPISTDLYDTNDTPSEAALAASLGCGNPTALIDLAPGQDVLDLGSGGGLDVLLSAPRRQGENACAATAA